jgi:hypothetical protein
MVAYEFYLRDKTGEERFIGVLQERRKNTDRITQESIDNLARKVVGGNSDVNNFYFVQIEM